MSKNEKNKNKGLPISDQFQNLRPNVDIRQAEIVLEERVWRIYKSMCEIFIDNGEEKWPEAERKALTKRLLEGDQEALKELEALEKKWID